MAIKGQDIYRRFSLCAIALTGLIAIASLVLLNRSNLISTSRDDAALQNPRIGSVLVDAADTTIFLDMPNFRLCGTYFLSFPEKCIVNGEYVPRNEFPDQLSQLISPSRLIITADQ